MYLIFCNFNFFAARKLTCGKETTERERTMVNIADKKHLSVSM
jgi:hypothetical protein